MTNPDSITTEVRETIADSLARGEIVRVEWITNKVIAKKSNISGDDLSFYQVCAYTHVKDVVRRCIGKYDPKPMRDPELALDGFDHLQRAYPVERQGDRVLVPVDKLADVELLARAAEYDAMAIGCRDHAREIRKFVKDRVVTLAAE